MQKVLIIEDDVNLGITLTGALEMQHFKVHYLTNGENVMKEFHTFQPDIVLLDVILNAELDGFEIGKLIRAESNVPILFTTSRDGNEDFQMGFSIENTDYVRKPYRLMEILLRIEKILSKQQDDTTNNTYQVGNYSFFPAEQSLKIKDTVAHLNNYESAVLTLLCKNINTFISKREIIECVWQVKETKIKEGSLNNILTNLRKYLNKDGCVGMESRINVGIKLTLKENELV
ncbi:MAG TPA: response regulator transcription factor [Paludibacter sp.]